MKYSQLAHIFIIILVPLLGVFAAAIFIFNAARAGNLSQSSTSQTEVGVRILESNSTGIVLELFIPDFQL